MVHCEHSLWGWLTIWIDIPQSRNGCSPRGNIFNPAIELWIAKALTSRGSTAMRVDSDPGDMSSKNDDVCLHSSYLWMCPDYLLCSQPRLQQWPHRESATVIAWLYRLPRIVNSRKPIKTQGRKTRLQTHPTVPPGDFVQHLQHPDAVGSRSGRKDGR